MTQKAELSQFVHERIKRVVCNNAVWCDTVCRVHGLPGEFKDVRKFLTNNKKSIHIA
jgi:hypothetical protein